MMKKVTFLFLMLLLIAGTSYSQDKQDWKYTHPLPQANNVRKIKMLSETEWVGVGGNGLFQHTSNSGANWYFQFFAGKTNAATLATPGNYDITFFNGSTGIVTGDQGYIGRTVDGGVTFTEVGAGLLPTNTRCWSLWFADANTGYIGCGAQGAFTTHILKTTNAGLNWTIVYSDLSGSTSYLTALGGIDNQNVIAAWANGSQLKTTNGGTNWTITPVGFTTNVNGISFLNSTTGFAVGSSGSAKRTTDAGATWTAVNTPTADWSMFQVKIVSETEIYAVGDPTYLYKTTDLGTTWQSLPIVVAGPSVPFIWYSLDKSGSTYVISGDYGIVAKSTDGCATWFSESTQYSSQLMYDITTVPGTSKYWTVGRPFTPGTRNIFYSTNSGTTWTPRDLGVAGDFFAISMINENTGYVSGQNNKVLKTTDGGISWITKTGPSPVATSQLYSMEFIDENTGFVFVNFSTVAGGNVFKTTNGGDNWSQYTTGATSENIYSADMFDANTGYCVMNSSNRPVYRTTNGGVNWTASTVGTGFTGSIHGVSAPDANTVYVCQSSGTNRVAKSTNGGVNWTQIPLPAVADYNYIDFKDANTGYVGGNNTAIICRTTNGGASWTFQNTHNITSGRIYVSPGDTAWALGGSTAILRYVGPSSQVKITLTALMEGMYSPGTNLLARDENVKVYLRNAVSPYALKDSATGTIDSLTHSGNFTFANTTSGTYYIEVKTLNCIETWSRSGGETIIASGSYYPYDFTTSGSKAYGNNMALVGSSYCLYSGDINLDGTIDGGDLSLDDNAAVIGLSGYVPEDVNGDYTTDASDLSIVDNNATIGVFLIRP